MNNPIHPARLDQFVAGYLEAAFADVQEEPEFYGKRVLDIAPSSLASIMIDCREFARTYLPELEPLTPRRAGSRFYLNRNGHGTGFWDEDRLPDDGRRQKLSDAAHKYGESDLYIGDDGIVYIFPERAFPTFEVGHIVVIYPGVMVDLLNPDDLSTEGPITLTSLTAADIQKVEQDTYIIQFNHVVRGHRNYRVLKAYCGKPMLWPAYYEALPELTPKDVRPGDFLVRDQNSDWQGRSSARTEVLHRIRIHKVWVIEVSDSAFQTFGQASADGYTIIERDGKWIGRFFTRYW